MYKFNKVDAIDLAQRLGAETKEKHNEIFFKYCPYCNGGGKDKDTFSINIDSGAFKCLRATCGKKGHFAELARDFDYKLDFGENKVFKKMPNIKPEPKPKAIEYMASRGIGELLTKKLRITTHKENDNILVFPFYNENDELVFVKYRKTWEKLRNKEYCQADTMPILFGMNLCVGFERLIICEGQFDSASVLQSGIDNAVSVPIGAVGFTWIEHCWEWLKKFKEVIVFGDIGADGKITLLDTLIKRLPQRVKAVRKQDYLGEKDANDILRKYGEEAIRKAIENAEIPNLPRVKSLADVAAVDLNKLPKVLTGTWELDKYLGGLYFGKLTILTGERGQGKSTFASQWIANAAEQNIRTFVYSGELADYHFRNWIDVQLAGVNNVSVIENEYGELETALKQGVAERLSKWYRDKIYLYDNTFVDDDEDDLPPLIEQVIKQYDTKLIVIDNLMTALNCNASGELNQMQTEFVKKLSRICKRYDVHIVLIVHPRKTSGEIGNNDVAGSSNITNLADAVVVYTRNEEEQNGSLVTVTKNRTTGKNVFGEKSIKLTYSPKTKRIVGKNDNQNKAYGWERITAGENAAALTEDLPF